MKTETTIKTGMNFEYGVNTYQITRIDDLDGLDNMKKALIANDKKPIMLFAYLVLKTGKLSVRSAGFYVFNCETKFVKI